MRIPEENKNRAFDKGIVKNFIKIKYVFSWLSLALLCVAAFIPNRIRDFVAVLIASILSFLPLTPRRVAYANMRTAFPDLSAKNAVLYIENH